VESPGARARKPFDEDRVAELVRAIFVLLRLRRHPDQCIVLLKRAEEFVVARARLVHAGQNPVDNEKPRVGSDASRRDAGSRPDTARATCRVLQRANDGRANRQDAAAALPGPIDERSGCWWDHVRLVEWQPLIKFRISGRGNACRMREARHACVSIAQRPQRGPVEDQPGRRCFEGNWL
jgi:hypothetical protein